MFRNGGGDGGAGQRFPHARGDVPLDLANESGERKPIHIPFGTWDYDGSITQTLDRPHAEGIAAALDRQIAAGEPGIPVYQGHPDVPEYAGKYPDKGALGWVRKILVNEDSMECNVEWDRDPGKGFGWFSPYWTGETPAPGPGGKRNLIVDGLTSIGLVNNPNIREFRLANEAGDVAAESRSGAEFQLPAHIVSLARRREARISLVNVVDANGAGHGADGKFDGSGSGSGGGSWRSQMPDDWSSDIIYRSTDISRDGIADRVNKAKAELGRATTRDDDIAFRKRRREALHHAAITAGLKYNHATHMYE